MMNRLTAGWLVMAIVTAWIAGCRSLPALPPIAMPSKHRIKAPVDPPPGLEQAGLTPLSGEARARAGRSLEMLREQLPDPDFLKPADPHAEAASDMIDREPTRAAQRAYLEGRAAWRAGNNADAKRQLQIAHRLAPGSAEILRLLGWIYTTTGNKVRGAYYLQKAASLDPDHTESVLLLSRFALEQGRWPDAIAGLTAVLDLIDALPDADPALRPLIRYNLAGALRHEGYAHAAIGQYQQFFTAPRDDLRPTRWARELLFLDRQHGQTAMALGDLLHQLDRPMDARIAYSRARAYGVTDEPDLDKRTLYTDLRLGDADAAIDRVIESIRASHGDADTLKLAGYLTEQGVSATVLARRLRTVYETEDHPPALALAIADLLPPRQGQALLRDHLRARPRDRVVFEQLLRSMLSGSDTDQRDLAEAIDMTAQVMSAAPRAASVYARMLIEAARDPGALVTTINTLPVRRRIDPTVSVIRGIARVELDQRESAQRDFASALRSDPSLTVARIELVRLMIAQGRYERAAELLEPLADSADGEAVRLRVEVLSQTGDPREALALLEDVLGRSTTDTRLYIQKSRLQRRLSDAAAAEQTLLDALNSRPDDEALYAELFEMYDKNLVPDSVRQYQRLMRRMLGAIPHSRLARLQRADWLEAKGQFDQAEPLLLKLLEDNDRDLPAVVKLVRVYVRARRRDDAIALLEQLIETYPRDREVLALTRSLYFQPINDTDRLLAVEQRILDLEPPGPDRSRRQALLLVAMGESERAVTVLEEALARGDIEQPELFLAPLWQLLLELDRGDEAEQRLRDAMRRFPDQSADLRYLWAMLINAQGDRQRAEQIMVDILRDNPDHAPTNNDLAYTWTEQGRKLDEALAMVNRAVDAEPDNEAYLDSKGWVLYKRGDFEGAVKWLRLSLDSAKRKAGDPKQHTDPNRRVALLQTQAVVGDHLGDALFRLGHDQAAIRTWAEAMSKLTKDVPQTGGDLEGLRDRLAAKITAARQDKPPAIAETAEPAPPQPQPDEAAPEPEPVEPPVTAPAP